MISKTFFKIEFLSIFNPSCLYVNSSVDLKIDFYIELFVAYLTVERSFCNLTYCGLSGSVEFETICPHFSHARWAPGPTLEWALFP